MVNTQVQIPDGLFLEVKRLAEENKMSFADVVRRGLEEIVRHYPSERAKAGDWELPPSYNMGEAMAPEEKWTTLCHE